MDISQVLSVLSKNVKRSIILHLFTCHQTECDVQMLVHLLKEKQSNVSKHLNDLRTLNIVDVNKKGLYNYYFLNEEFKEKYFNLLTIIYQYHKQNIDCECLKDGHIK
ncbi:transcriptional regulator [Mycoplasmopsis felis]|uniref:ArsR/SmtB family transcription factor n=1 Tax=Mycoplasmopsis felis TaxID=33923 RepID=UPI002AF6BEE8|nr:transcriptional regulator [Mycoplasmopsis felis]WQQ01914.1 transcriptional regulator [Mycoplasmopsis felis]